MLSSIFTWLSTNQRAGFWVIVTGLTWDMDVYIKTRLYLHIFSRQLKHCIYSKVIDHKINAFEMWCYRRMLRISWTSHTTNIDVLQKIGVKETAMLNTLKDRKLSYAGHIMRNTSGYYDTLLTTIEGRLSGERGRGRPIKTNMGRRSQRLDWLQTMRTNKESSRKEALTWNICIPQQWT